tara:strand:+ start:38 stop:250 length:213 start_codon:yes stop_codon:yes gene_type:complete
MTTAKADRFEVTLKFQDTISILMVKKALQDAVSTLQESQDKNNFSEKEGLIRNLKVTLEQVNNYKPVRRN